MAKKTTKKKTPKKNGRPTKYRDTFPDRVDAYIEKCLETEEGKERELPTKAGLAVLFRVSLVTIDTWGKEHPKFLCALERVQSAQQLQLVNRGLNGTANSTIAKLLLSANHGINEKQITDHGVTDELADLLKEIGGSNAGLPIKD